ncbi:hypothetical protein POTOM_061363 [Populus tomentosa]|uniref:Tf2-1-like SH3-like domain-containing protein n=1 Tax=Populus tomentosa TaxID=118781 RepID=A0A8X8BVF8_POPTO|nr:hypothetical protein POTOM_061363 [Populus tomentosa]
MNATIEKWDDHLGKPYVYQEDEKELGIAKMKLRKCNWAGLFRLVLIPEERKVQFVKLKLKGSAHAWWSNVEERLRRTLSTSAKPIVESTRENVNGDVKGKEKAFGEGPQCYKCKGHGNFAVVCPTRDQRVAYIYEKDLVFDDDEIYHEGDHIQEETDSKEERLQATDLPILHIENLRQVLETLITEHLYINKGKCSFLEQKTNFLGFIVSHKGVEADSSKVQAIREWPEPQSFFDISSFLGLATFYHSFKAMKDDYASDKHFKDIWAALQSNTSTNIDFSVADKQFEVGDQVLIRLRSERFPPGSYNKLHARRAGPFTVLKKLGPNAYVIDLPPSYAISLVFSIEDLTAFTGQNDFTSPSDDTPIRVPSTPCPYDVILVVIDHQFVSTRRGGYYKFLVQWAHKPLSDSIWLQGDEVHRLAPDVYRDYI